jgi:hypothetical protein
LLSKCRLRGLLFRVVGLGLQLGMLGLIIGTISVPLAAFLIHSATTEVFCCVVSRLTTLQCQTDSISASCLLTHFNHLLLPSRRLRGLLFRVVGLGLQLGMLGLIIGIRADAKWSQLLAGGYASARACIACSHVIIAWCIPRARKLSSMTAVAGLALAAGPAWLATQQEGAYATHVAVMAAVAAGEVT